MGHIDAVALKHYSHNTSNIDLVRIMMNELPGTHIINNIVHIILNFYQINKAEEI